MELEVVIPIQDKNPQSLEECLKSVRRSTNNKIVSHLVDLGSKRSNLYKDMAQNYDLRYSYLDYREWNKPMAANYALKRTNADWFGVLDGDYIIEKDFFEKILKETDPNCFIQCRGYEMQEENSRLKGAFSPLEDTPFRQPVRGRREGNKTPRLTADDLVDYISFANAITKYDMDSRMYGAYGGWQAFPSAIGKEINGYDERFGLYGGEHHEIRNRLINKGLEERRLQGDPLLIHQTHQSWVTDGETKKDKIKAEQKKHEQIIKELEKGNRVKANMGKIWGEV